MNLIHYRLKATILICILYIFTAPYSQSQNIEKPIAALKQERSLRGAMKLIHQIDSIYALEDKTDFSDKIVAKIASFNNDTLLGLVNYHYFYYRTDEKSIEYGLAALEAFDRIHFNHIYCEIVLQTSRVYRDFFNFPDALKYAKRAESKLKNLSPIDTGIFHLLSFNSDKTLIENAHLELILDYIGNKYFDTANIYIQKLGAIYKQNKTLSTLCWIDYFTGYLQMVQGKVNMAEIYFNKCLAYRDSLKNISEPADRFYYPFCQSYLYKSKTALGKGDFHIAKLYGLESYHFALENLLYVPLIDASKNLINVYDSLHMNDSSLFYAKEQIYYTENLYNTSYIFGMYSITHTNEIKAMEEERRNAELALQRKHNLQYGAIAIGILTLLLIFFLFSTSVIVSKGVIDFVGSIALLLVFEFINLVLHPIVGEFFHHSPFYMLLTMVVLASLLIPAHHKIEHWVKEKLIEKNNKIRMKKDIGTIDNHHNNHH